MLYSVLHDRVLHFVVALEVEGADRTLTAPGTESFLGKKIPAADSLPIAEAEGAPLHTVLDCERQMLLAMDTSWTLVLNAWA